MRAKQKNGVYFALIYALISIFLAALVDNGFALTGVVLAGIAAIAFCVIEMLDRNKWAANFEIPLFLKFFY